MAEKHDPFLTAALEYAARGWQVVILHQVLRTEIFDGVPKAVCSCHKGANCPSAGKHPRLNKWPEKASSDVAELNRQWAKAPGSNVGVLLGERSGLVDFEYDSDEEKATFLRLFSDNVPETVTYTSARGQHFLFKWRSGLPGGAIWSIGPLKCRFGNVAMGAMSVFPPSQHPDGPIYRFTCDMATTAVAELPEEVYNLLWNWDGIENLAADEWISVDDRTKAIEAMQNMPLERCSDRHKWMGTGLALSSVGHDLYTVFDEWSRKCPENYDAKVNAAQWKDWCSRKTALSVASLIFWAKGTGWMPSWTMNGKATKPPKPTPEEKEEAKQSIKDMRMVIVESDPPKYRLYSETFNSRGCGFVELTPEQLCNFSAMRVQVVKQAKIMFPRHWNRTWDLKAQRLLDQATIDDAPVEERRLAVVAELIWEKLNQAGILPDGKELSPDGSPQRMANGTISFKFTKVWTKMNLGADKVLRNELSSVFTAAGIKRDGNTHRHKATPEAMQKLLGMIEAKKH